MATRFSAWRRWREPAFRWSVFAAGLIPLAVLAWRGDSGGLGANPIEYVERNLGDWALRFLLIGLALTPLRKLTGWTMALRRRRMIGLFAFFYLTLHLTTYLYVDQGLDWQAIWKDVTKRPYITIGVAAFLILTPLAATSLNRMVRWLGGKRWRRLHRLVYLAAALGVIHYYLLVKADVRQPLLYAAILAILLGYRLATARRAAGLAVRPARAMSP